MRERDGFGSRFGALVVIAGSAVGLGNIWRFPYMVGTNGGAAFILIYLIFVFVICLPMLISELTIGRRSGKTAFGSLSALTSGAKPARYAGYLYLFIPTIVLSYYCVIGGMTIEYFVRSLGIHTVSTPWSAVLWMLAFLGLTGLIVIGGVRDGIERFSKFMMPALFVIVILIAIRSMTLPARGGAAATASEGLAYLFKPDFSKVTSHTVLAALGQAFFSLSIGSGVLMTYGSYINRNDNISKTAAQIAVFDLIFAIIAGCAVIPAVFALKDNPELVLSNNTDSALVFNILPEVFPEMPLGVVVGAFFFFALILAALTSSLSQYEVPVAFLVEEHGISRKKAGLIVFGIAFVIGAACALRGQILGFLDGLCANWLMPLGGVIAVIYVGWLMKREDFHDELSSGGKYAIKDWFVTVLKFLIRYIAPVGVAIVFLTQLFA